MSSEESEVEADDIHIFYRIKTLEWRRNIDKELGIVDAARIHDPRYFKRQGAKPVRRRRGDVEVISGRGPVVGLPRSFYNNDWFQAQNLREFQLRIPAEPFRWLEIVVSQ
jgi:hypothetical protein